MDYQEELRELARKRNTRNNRNKIIMLIILLLAVLFIMNFIGKQETVTSKKSAPIKVQTAQEKAIHETNATK